MVLEFFKAIIFGIVEGITEWLPVSSTGHLILVEEFIKFTKVSDNFFKVFDVVIQLGAILAVVLIYFKDIWPFTNDTKKAYTKHGLLSHLDKNITNLWGKILVACVPAITYKDALIIGVFQLLAAIFPGVSRSGATIIGALLIGVSRKVSAEFTFYLAVPVMFGASLLKIVKYGLNFTGTEIALLILGMVTAFIVSLWIIKFLMNYIKKHDFKVFGWYRIILGALVLLYFLVIK